MLDVATPGRRSVSDLGPAGPAGCRVKALTTRQARGGNQIRAARLVGVSRRTFLERLDEDGVAAAQGRQPR